MSADDTKSSKVFRVEGVEGLPVAPPLAGEIKAMDDAEITRRTLGDPDAAELPASFWDRAEVMEPDGTVLISLRLPRRVVSHFKATGKGYQTRISAVLSSYVAAQGKKTG
jgi:uncharacterized protein (DUF4415 family)